MAIVLTAIGVAGCLDAMSAAFAFASVTTSAWALGAPRSIPATRMALQVFMSPSPLLRLGDDPQIGLRRLPARGIGLLRFLVGDRGDDDHVLALLPVHRRGHLVLGRELAGVEDPQHLVEVTARGHR